MSFFQFQKNIISRLTSLFVLFNFLISQNLYSQTEFQYHNESGNYQAVKSVTEFQAAESALAQPDLPVEDAISAVDVFRDNPLSVSEKAESQRPRAERRNESAVDFLADERVLNSIEHGAERIAEDIVHRAQYEYERYSFKEAIEQLRPEYATAVIVKSLTKENIESLLNLSFEVGIAVFGGETVLFTSGNEEEIRVLLPSIKLLDEASFISHTHVTEESQSGPSLFDIQHAVEAPFEEYVLTKNGAYAYNRDGIRNEGRSYSSEEYLELLNQSVKESEKKDQSYARSLLNEFIKQADIYNETSWKEIEIFRLSAEIEGVTTDNFDRPDVGANWTALIGTWKIDYDSQSGQGKLYMEKGFGLGCSKSDPGILSLAAPPSSYDYKIEGDFTFENPQGSRERGVIGRYQNAGNYYYGQYSIKEGKYRIIKVINGESTVLAEQAAPVVTEGSTHKVGLSIQGATLKLYFDNTEVLQAGDFELQTGSVGFYTQTTSDKIDNFQVTTYTEAPRVDPPFYTNNPNFILGGTKKAGASIWINGAEVIPFDPSTTWSYPLILAADGVYPYSIQAKYSDGRESELNNVTITLDRVAPTGSLLVNNGADYTNNPDISLALTGADALSGIDQVRYSVNGGQNWIAWENFEAVKTFTLSEDGLKQIQYQIRDKAGNVSTFSDSITLDTQVPATALTSDRYAFARNYQLEYLIQDANLGEAAPHSEKVLLASGKNTFTRTFTDLAGNATTTSWTIYLDENAERGIFFDYDENGNIISRVDLNGEETQYEYDPNNQLIKVIYPDGSVVRYTYNARGDRTSMQDSTGTTFYLYDNANMLRRLIQPTGQIIDYNYDNSGNLFEIIYAGLTVRYQYNEANRLTEAREIREGQADSVTSYVYNDAGDLTSQTLPNGIRTSYLYDIAGRLTDMIHEKVNPDESTIHIATYHYTLDAAGNRTQMIETQGAVGIQTVRTVDYDYDLFGRLETETDSSRGVTDYTYDKSGNRLSKEFTPSVITSENPRVVTSYTYGIDNHLTSLAEEKFDDLSVLISSRTESFVYDARGNLIQKITPERTYHYDYDSENRLVMWTDEKDFVEFIYDADGNRLGKRMNGEMTYYVVDPNRLVSQVLAELDAEGNVKESYTYGLDRLSSTDHESLATSHFLQDGLGSSIGLTDSTGLVTESYSYDAFGNSLNASPFTNNAFQYTGEQFDSETGLVYLRARYYDPSLGRFISRDPLSGRYHDTQSINGYTYVTNDPVNSIDPTGLEGFPPVGLPGASAAGEFFEQALNGLSKVYGPIGDATLRLGLSLGFRSVPAINSALGAVRGGITGYNIGIERGYGDLSLGTFYTSLTGAVMGGAMSYYGVPHNYAGLFTSTALNYAIDTKSNIYGTSGIGNSWASNLLESWSDSSNRNLWGNPPGGGGSGFNSYWSGGDSWGGGGLLSSTDNTYNNYMGALQGGGSGWTAGGWLSPISDFGSSLTNSFTPSFFGGVLLDKSLSVTGLNINDITGVTYDPYTGQMILLGQEGGALPEIPVDYFLNALKAIYGTNQDPGVTIDPAEKANGDPDWSKPQIVTHFGGIENTALGWTVFEADRLMKSINLGKDNITGTITTQDGYNISESYVASQIPGFQNMLTRWSQTAGSGERHSRFWFVPKEMELVRSDNQDAFVFDENSVELLTEDLLIGGGAEDPDAAAYADFFTQHYEEFAQLYPIFEELKKAARAVALAKFIYDHDIPVDVSWLQKATVPVVPTPTTTPVGKNSIGQFTIRGGVVVDFISGSNFNYLSDLSGQVSSLRTDTLAPRPTDTASQWNLTSSGTNYVASAFSFAPTRKDGNFFLPATDLAFGAVGDFSLSWQRFYNSFDLGSTALGHGWQTAPYAVEFPETIRSYTVNDEPRNLYPHVRFINFQSKQTENMVLTAVLADGTVIYSPDGKLTGTYLTMNLDNTLTVVYADQSQVQFMADGRLDYIEDRDGNRIDYVYDGSARLSSIVDISSGRSITATYNAQNKIININGPEGKSIDYTYDAVTGDLKTAAESWSDRTITYNYDNEHRLLSAVDHTNKTLFVNEYDLIGRLVSQTDSNGNVIQTAPDLLAHETVSTDPVTGAQSRLSYDSQMRLTTIQNPYGNLINYTYGGDYGPTSLTDARGNTTNISYDNIGNRISSTNSLGHTSRFDYGGELGDVQLTFQEDGTGFGRFFEYTDTGNLKSITEGAQPVRDADGNLTSIYLTNFKTQYDYDLSGNLSSVTDANNHTTGFLYDAAGNLTKITDGLTKETDFIYENETVEAARHTVASYGNAQLDTASVKFGSAAGQFDGNGDYLTVPDHADWDLGTGNFTMDFWVKLNSISSTMNFIDLGNPGSTGIRVGYSAGATKKLRVRVNGNTYDANWTPTAGVWYHIAVVRNGSSLSAFVNGSQLGSSFTNSGNVTGTTQGLTIGRTQAGSDYLNGQLDELRISNSARWSSNFTLPTTAHTTDTNTKLLMHFDGADGSTEFKDSSQTFNYITNRLSQVIDPLDRTVDFEYHPTSEKLTRVSNAFGEVKYSYDNRDRLSEIRNPLNQLTQFQYNNADQITETREVGDSGNPLDDITASFDYDRFGNLISLAGPLGGATSFGYDVLNRLTQIFIPESVPVAKVQQHQTENITDNSADVRFTVSETVARAMLRIYEKNSDAYKTMTLEGPLSGENVFNLESLESGTEYEYEIEIIKSDGRHAVTRKHDFETLGNPPTPENIIVSDEKIIGQVYDVTDTTVEIGVYDPDVNYQLVDDYKITLTPVGGGTPIVNTFPATFQGGDGNTYLTVVGEITGLTANTDYDFSVEIISYPTVPFDNPAPLTGTVRTGDPADSSPAIFIENSVTPEVDRAIVDLQTDENLLWADVAVINYYTGERKDYYFYNVDNPGQLLIPDLEPGTSYYLRVFSRDLSGNDSASAIVSFSTQNFDGTSSLILKSRVTAQTSISADIEVLTDEVLSKVVLEYREKNTMAWSELIVDNPQSRNVQIPLTGLQAGINYEYRIRGVDAVGNKVTDDIKDLVLYQESLTPVIENSEGIFKLVLDDTVLDAAMTGGAIGWSLELSKKFFSSITDQYDYLIFIPTLAAGKRLSLETEDSVSDNNNGSFYLGAQNNIEGIGQGIYDFRDLFGSSQAGELEGLVFLDSGLSAGTDFRFASSDFVQERNTALWQNVLTQEVAHRFGSFLTSGDENPYGMLGRALAHWGVFYDADFSPMDGNDWQDNGDGTFTLVKSYIDEAAFKRTDETMLYNDLDLYTMGLLDESQVGVSFVIENPTLTDGRGIRMHSSGNLIEVENPDGSWSGPYYLESGTVINGMRTDLTIEDIIALEGQRNPDATASPNEFTTAIVLVSNDEETNIDSLEMQNKLAYFKETVPDLFDLATGQRGNLTFPTGVMGGGGSMMSMGDSLQGDSLEGDSLAGDSIEEHLHYYDGEHPEEEVHWGVDPFEPLDLSSLKPVDFETKLNTLFSGPANILNSFQNDLISIQNISLSGISNALTLALNDMIPVEQMTTLPSLIVPFFEQPVLVQAPSPFPSVEHLEPGELSSLSENTISEDAITPLIWNAFEEKKLYHTNKKRRKSLRKILS